MQDSRQQNALLAQLNQKRALKQAYLRQAAPDTAPLTGLAGLAMTNLMLFAIREKKDVFAAMRRIRATASGEQTSVSFGTVLDWLAFLAEAVGASPYELLLDDAPKRRRIVLALLAELHDFDGWESDSDRPDGAASFALPDFYSGPGVSAALVFEKAASDYSLRLENRTPDPGDLFPAAAVLWTETSGPLQKFFDETAADLGGSWGALKQQLRAVQEDMAKQAQKLSAFAEALAELPPQVHPQTLLQKEAAALSRLLDREKAAVSALSEDRRNTTAGKNAESSLLLLSGAVCRMDELLSTLPALSREDLAEAIGQVAYLIESAAEPV